MWALRRINKNKKAEIIQKKNKNMYIKETSKKGHVRVDKCAKSI